MMPLGLLMLLLGTPPSTTAAATGTDITIGMTDTVVPQGPIDILKTKLPCGLSDNQRLQNTQAVQADDPGLGSPEQHHGPPTSVPATHARNDLTPDNLLTVVDITHNSSLVLTCEGSRFRQVDGATECCPLMLENSGDMKDEDSRITQRAIPLHSLVSKQEESVPAMTETITDANLCKSNQPGFTSATCSQHTISTEKASYDHQSIVMLQDDPVVQESASFLFEKDPKVSTLLSYQMGALQVIRGTRMRLTVDSHVMLVGHGSRASDGEAMLGGYRAEEVAKVVEAMETVDGSLGKVSVVGCELGKELAFATHLLQGLRRLGVEAILHLHRSALSVTHAGEIVTREGGDGRPVWRQGDDNNKVVACLDRAGNLLTRVEGSQRGQVIPHYQGQALNGPEYYDEKKDVSPPEWPESKKQFLSNNIYADVNVQAMTDLQDLTWRIFYEARPGTSTPTNCNYRAGKNDQPTTQPATLITTLQDVVREIRFHAKKAYKPPHAQKPGKPVKNTKTNGAAKSSEEFSYYVLNNYLYKLNNKDLYFYLVGHCGEHKDLDVNSHEYPKLRLKLKANEFNKFCDETFVYGKCKTICAYIGQYFLASVFAESVRNFRNFPLFLMSVAGYKVNKEDSVNFYDEKTHPMATGKTWLLKPRRGFHGCSREDLDEDDFKNKINIGGSDYKNNIEELPDMVRRELHMFQHNYDLLKNSHLDINNLAELINHLNSFLIGKAQDDEEIQNNDDPIIRPEVI